MEGIIVVAGVDAVEVDDAVSASLIRSPLNLCEYIWLCKELEVAE